MSGVKNRKYILLMTVLIFSMFSVLGSADARQYNLTDDSSLAVTLTGTYGVGMRVSDRDNALLEDIGADDGNRNFDQWSLYNNKVTALADIEYKYKNFGVFVRPKAFYDYSYMHDNDNNSPNTDNAYVGGLINRSDKWADKIEDIHGANATILDAFGYARFRLGEVPCDFRIGRQVISWGESTFIPGISGVQSPIDIAAAQAVGTNVKEIYLPTASAYFQAGYNSIGLRAYYMFEWEENKMMEGGTYFSTSDMLDKIRAPILVDLGGGYTFAIPRGNDEQARNDGQYGVALTYTLPWNATEIGFYYLNYHDRGFVLEVGSDLKYFLHYPEDIKEYGFTATTTLMDTQVYAEVLYRQGIKTNVGAAVEGGDYYQANAGFTWVGNPGMLAENVTFLGETAYGHELDFNRNLSAWKYVLQLQFDWYQVLPQTDLALTFNFSDVPMGSISVMGLTQWDRDGSVGVKFTYAQNLTIKLVYENRMAHSALRDRDTLGLIVTYAFL